VTDGQTDRIAIANTRSAVPARTSFQLSVFSSVLVFLSQVSLSPHNRLFLDLFIVSFTFLVPFKTFLVFF